MSYTAGDDLPTFRVARHDGWTLERQLGFLEALAGDGSVARAAAAVGLSPSSAYRLRGRSDGLAFDYGWRAATAMAYHHIREIALDRIAHGVTTPQLYRGEIVSTRTIFSDRLLVAMLDHLKPVAADPRQPRRQVPDPGAAYAATIAAFTAAIETGSEPAVPTIDLITGEVPVVPLCAPNPEAVAHWQAVFGYGITDEEMSAFSDYELAEVGVVRRPGAAAAHRAHPAGAVPARTNDANIGAPA